ncbi:MAG: cupredoxin family protein [Alphaproteobacteria bacterium]
MDIQSKLTVGLLCMGLTLPLAALAAGKGDHGHDAAVSIGEPGRASEVSRTIKVVMRDTAYLPVSITVKKGETIRFSIRNAGELVHEFNIGTAAMHAEHQKEMMKMVESGALEADRLDHSKMEQGSGGMSHDDPNSVLLEPQKSGEVIWKFTADAELEFSCNVPGHREAGMVGAIQIRK